MLIVANGAFKSGSTWLYNILLELTGFPPPPAEYLNPEWRNPSIAPEQLTPLLKSLTPTDHYLVKNHFGKAHDRELLLSSPHVRVFDIQRDLRDVVVSAYYHVQRKEGYTGDFASYYWQEGRHTAQEVVKYHATWDAASSQVYVASYESLHHDFSGEITRIAAFLNLTPDAAEIERIHRVTTLDSLRKRYQEQDRTQKFFRKGVIGDWESHFDQAMQDDLGQIKPPQKPSFLRRLKSRLDGR